MTRREINSPQELRRPLSGAGVHRIGHRKKFVGALASLLLILCTPCFAARTQSVTLSWNPNPEPDIAGYRVYLPDNSYRTTSGDPKVIEVGNTTTLTIPNLGEGTTYLFTVAAYSTASLESQASVEVSYTGCDSDTTLLPVVNGIREETTP